MTRPTGGVDRPRAPNAVEAVVVAVEPEREPAGLAGAGQVARTLSFVAELAVERDGPSGRRRSDPIACTSSFRRIRRAASAGDVPVPAAVIGDGGRTLLPTNEPFAARPL